MSKTPEVPERLVPKSPAPDLDAAGLIDLQAAPPSREYLEQMWEKRDLAFALPLEELRTTHQVTLLGNVWHLANPLLSVAVYYVIFGIILNASRGVDNYILFLVIGVFAYRQSSQSFEGGARSIVSKHGLMRSFRFPRAIVPLSQVFSVLLTFGFELMVVAAVAILTGEGFAWRWLALPIVIGVHTSLNLGGAFITARLNNTFQDVQQLIPFVMRLLMYASGVMFPIRDHVENAPGWIQATVRWNPLLATLDLYRWVFLGSALPHGEVARLVLVSALALLLGFRFFVAAEDQYGRG